MSGNRSLDEFAEAGAGADEQAAGSDATDDASPNAEAAAPTAEPSDTPVPVDSSTEADGPAPDGETESPDVEDGTLDPPASTYVWHPDGAPCDACGTAVEERWRDGDDLVCAGCKEW